MLSPTVLKLTPTVLKVSPTLVLITLHSSDVIHHCTDIIPLHVLKVSANVLNTLHSTEAITHCTEQPPQYWMYPPRIISTVLMLSPHSTEQPPQYWCYSPMYWCYPPLYWATSTVLKLCPTVLMLSPRCTEQSPMYWTTSTVLNRHYMGWYCQNLKWQSCRNSQHPLPYKSLRYNFKFAGRHFYASIINNIFPVEFKIGRVTHFLKVI